MGIQVASSLPAGSISPFAGSVAPTGWAFMYGQAIRRENFAALFLAIGTVYGVGDGLTTFNLPDARGRALFGKDDMGGTAANRATVGGSGLAGITLGAVGGGEISTLTTAQMPSHSHSIESLSNSGTGSQKTYGSGYTAPNATGKETALTGASGAHVNMPPALIINYIIKT